MRRLLTTILTTMLLTSAGVVYAWFTRPLLRVNSLPQVVMERLDPPAPSPEFSSIATQHLQREDWAVDAPYRHRDGNTFVYCHDYLMGNDNRSVSLSPFAIVMADSVIEGKETVPVTLVADTAQMEFSTSLKNNEFDVGRITSGQLLGEVRIEGPDNLLIKGRNFYVDENSRRIWSDDVVQFRFEGSRGRGRGVEIRLASGKFEAGALNAESVRSIRIREDIILELLRDGGMRTTKTKPTDLIHVRSRGHLEFDLETNIAMLETGIQVRQPTGPDEYDTLKCDLLSIQFDKQEREAVNVRRGSDRRRTETLKPVQLTAHGNIELQSMENQLLVTQITDLTYTLADRLIELSNAYVFPDGSGPTMKIVQQTTDMECRHLILGHDEDRKIRAVKCPGPGSLQSRAPTSKDGRPTDLKVRWSEELVMRPDPESDSQKLTLVGHVRVIQPSERSQVSASRMDLWLREEADDTKETSAKKDEPKIRLKPKRLEATGNVAIVSPQMSGPSERLVITFEEGPSKPAGLGDFDNPFSTASFGKNRKAGDKSTDGQFFDKHFMVHAETIEAHVRSDAPKGQSGIPEIHLSGDVIVRSSDKDEPMALRGETLHVLEDDKGNQRMMLTGKGEKLALVMQRDRRIEGSRIFLDRAANEAEVEGVGSLRFVVDQDLEGKKLDTPEPLEISWSQEMKFERNKATLIGEVTARLGDDKTQRQELICPRMLVHFSEPISFTDGFKGGNEKELGKLLDRIECLEHVKVNSFEFSHGRTAEERHAEFREVTISQKTGKTHAVGPGWITSWSQDRPRLSRAVSARANTSIEAAKPGWNYTRIEFLGELVGNYHHRTTTFKRDVVIVYGPVERLSQVIDPDAAVDGELPPDAVRIGCDELQVTERDNKRGRKTAELLGTGNAQLESRKLRAEADEVKYDEQKQLFTMLGKGTRKARVWQRDRVGSQWRGVAVRRFEYSERNQGLNASGVTGGSSGL